MKKALQLSIKLKIKFSLTSSILLNLFCNYLTLFLLTGYSNSMTIAAFMLIII